ncbi:MAG: sodium:proton antiporter [Clostridiales bacterium]|jgi:CPA1 family monovalent cation:H+ antiporter|nr:sodium:proton antiporter [Clostridiales bacterium]
MHITTTVIAILLAIVLSNVINSIFPRMPLPLLQIAFGCALSLLLPGVELTLEPEIFMVMVIAPLLFHDAEDADLVSLWKEKKTVFLMAFILVFLTVFAIGGIVYRLVPAIPMAACFALGAVLGPTDLVAVSSLASRIRIGDRVMHILLGEGLVNDASGLIAFHFAVAALSRGGVFSPAEAVTRLVLVSVGGFLVGFVIISIKRYFTDRLTSLLVHNTAAHMLIELLIPFLCYVAAEACGVSGVLAAVTAGSRQALEFKRSEPFEAEFGNAKHTLWEMLSFTLNSFVFLLLGLQFPDIVRHIWADPRYTHAFLILISALVTLILFAVRFLGVLAFTGGGIGEGARERVKNALLLTLAGVKGAVSLATAFALPLLYGGGAIFLERPLLLFITAGVIVLSLGSALALLPAIAGAPVGGERADGPEILILREVIAQLRREGTSDFLVESYNRRIAGLLRERYEKSEKRALRELRRLLYDAESVEVRRLRQAGEIGAHTYRDYCELLATIYHMSARGLAQSAVLHVKRIERAVWRLRIVRRLRALRERWASRTPRTPRSEGERQTVGERPTVPPSVRQYRREMSGLFERNTKLVLRMLAELREAGRYPEKLLAALTDERADLARQVETGTFRRAVQARLHQNQDDELLKGYYIERRVIHQFQEQKKITLEQANALRVDVNKLESFTLAHNNNEVVRKMLSLTASHGE